MYAQKIHLEHLKIGKVKPIQTRKKHRMTYCLRGHRKGGLQAIFQEHYEEKIDNWLDKRKHTE